MSNDDKGEYAAPVKKAKPIRESEENMHKQIIVFDKPEKKEKKK